MSLSVSGIVDEIVVVDSGSSDETIAIAKKFNSKVVSIKWLNDYAYARNVAIQHANYAWILFLDADETLENGKFLSDFLLSCDAKIGGVVIARHDHFMNLESSKKCIIPVGMVRLFRNHPDIYYDYKVHEIVNPSITRCGFKLKCNHNVFIHHHIHMHSKSFLEQKQTKYLAIIEDIIQNDSQAHWIRYQQGKTRWFFGEISAATHSFEGVVQARNATIELKIASLNNLGAINCFHGHYKKAKHFLNQSLKLNKNQSQAHFILGDVYQSSGAIPKALYHYLRVKTHIHLEKNNTYIPGGLYLFDFQKYYRIALCLYNLKLDLIGDIYLKKSLATNNHYVDALLLKARRLLKKKRFTKAHLVYNKLKNLNPEWNEVQHLEVILENQPNN